MKYIANAFLVLSILFAGPACAQESASIANAKAAAGSWLALTDAGNYSTSWEQASSLFKAAISQSGWQSAVQAARSPLGKLQSRAFKSATFTHSLPGAPDGEYVVLQYESQFEHKAHAIETVTPMQEKDGAWRVSGYFVK
jgi:hypothetical protein